MKLTILTILFAKTLSGVWLKATRSTDCQFYNDRSGLDHADWIKYYDKTPSEDTGPDRAKGGKYYMYIETSTMKSGGNARLISSLLTTDTQVCLSFYYHMFGDSIGELQIIFDGIYGSGYKGDIALDHILLFSGNCNNYTISIGESPVTGAITVEEALTLGELIGVIAGILGTGVAAIIGVYNACTGKCKGRNNTQSKGGSTISGRNNTQSKGGSTISGRNNTESKGGSTISGRNNTQSKGGSTISGRNNTQSKGGSTISGRNNTQSKGGSTISDTEIQQPKGESTTPDETK